MPKSIMIQGTGSSVGKSVINAGLCRIFLQDGLRVCPFKAQNMSLNSFVTSDGLEMGRAQVTQAAACRIAPQADMNPVLIKPTSDIGSQIIVQGRPIGNKTARQYQNKKCKEKLFSKIKDSFQRLAKVYDLMVMEGAGSPAEVNLQEHDIVNMKMAQHANAPVILVGDIDKGGVFAALVGTLQLLGQKDRQRVKGFLINKFRGDKSLLKEGINFLERKTKKPVLGVIPYFQDIRIPEEDSVALETAAKRIKPDRKKTAFVDIAIIKLPHISNFTDFDALANESDVDLSYISNASQLDHPDAIILPGTKNTIKDLLWLKQTGLAAAILSTIGHRPSTKLIGICGGYQMLGKMIYDTHNIESRQKEISGLNVLPVTTFLEKSKTLSQVRAEEISTGIGVFGYEIHHGRSHKLKGHYPAFKITSRHGKPIQGFDGTIALNKNIWGTYIHGVFDADNFRSGFLNLIRNKKGSLALNRRSNFDLDKELDKLAILLRQNIDLKQLYKIIGSNV